MRFVLNTFARPVARMLLTGSLFAATATALVAQDLHTAEQLVLTGQADKARAMLHQLPSTPEQHLLLCRVSVAEEDGDAAASDCEAAVAMANNSITQEWLAHAYGLQAQHAGPFGGLKLAGKVRIALETAFQMDPHSALAVNDLADFYVKAPGIVGGGTDKARDLAKKVESYLPEAAHRTYALAAEKDGDYGTAEREFKAFVGVRGSARAWCDLGNYYSRHKQYAQALDALQHAVAVDHNITPTTADCGLILLYVHQQPAIAQQWLLAYLNGKGQTDEQPTFKIHVALGELLAKLGDKNGARNEFDKALALASHYAPALKALHSL
ncbi:MAG: hypothetical protein PW735_02100 [Acidobacteriaceae bacterium]|nr:hypothetical protein [Acidobacteriaceae bacterium]